MLYNYKVLYKITCIASCLRTELHKLTKHANLAIQLYTRGWNVLVGDQVSGDKMSGVKRPTSNVNDVTSQLLHNYSDQ